MRNLNHVLICLILLAAYTNAQVTKESLRQAWEANWEAVSALEVSFTRTTNLGEREIGEGSIPTASYVYRWSSDHRIYWSQTVPGGAVENSQVSYDIARGEGRQRGIYKVTRVSSVNYAQGGGTEYPLYALRTPYPVSNPYYEFVWDLSALLARPDSQLRPETETIGGRTAAILDVTHETRAGSGACMTVWIDVERSAVPLRWHYRARPGGDVTAVCELSDYALIDDACWLPGRLLLTHSSGPNSGQSTEFLVVRDEGAPRLRLNADALGSAPEVVLTRPMFVINEDTGVAYQVARSGDLVPIGAERSSQTVYVHATNQREAVAGPSRKWMLILCVAGAVSGGVLGWMRFRR